MSRGLCKREPRLRHEDHREPRRRDMSHDHQAMLCGQVDECATLKTIRFCIDVRIHSHEKHFRFKRRIMELCIMIEAAVKQTRLLRLPVDSDYFHWW